MDIPKPWIQVLNNQIDIVGSFIDTISSAWWLFLDLSTLPLRAREDEGYDFFLSRGGRPLYGKAIETLTPKGVFIVFPIEFKWLKPTKGLGHLI